MRRLLVLTFALVAACNTSSAPQASVAGSWFGTGGGYVMNLALTQNGQNIAGTGSIEGVSGTVQLTATGTFSAPNFTLTMKSPGLSDFTYAGSVDAKGRTMSGDMNGGGFNHLQMALARR
jgi:hypothetical protein